MMDTNFLLYFCVGFFFSFLYVLSSDNMVVEGGYRLSHVWDGLLTKITWWRGVQTESRMGRPAYQDNMVEGGTD